MDEGIFSWDSILGFDLLRLFKYFASSVSAILLRREALLMWLSNFWRMGTWAFIEFSDRKGAGRGGAWAKDISRVKEVPRGLVGLT